MKMTSNAESTRAQHLNGRYLSQNDCSGGAKRPTLAPPTGGGQQPASRLRGSPRDTFFVRGHLPLLSCPPVTSTHDGSRDGCPSSMKGKSETPSTAFAGLSAGSGTYACGVGVLVSPIN